MIFEKRTFHLVLALACTASWGGRVEASTISRQYFGTSCNLNGKLQFLDRHPVECYPDWALKGWGGNTRVCNADPKLEFAVAYECQELATSSKVVEKKKTGCNDVKDKKLQFLDRHPLECSDGYALQKWHQSSAGCNSDQQQIHYECVQVPLGVCKTEQTACNKIVDKQIRFLDRHQLSCRSGSLMHSWKLEPDNCKTGEQRFTYECCEMLVKPTPGPRPGPETGKPVPSASGAPTTAPAPTTVGGDPHFTTWKGEHYEYHGQCDIVLAKDAKFANGAGLDLHLRTKIVRFWSYIKNAAVRIGNDILEVEGSAEPSKTENRYWINFEYQGELKEVGGFPVSVKIQSPIKRVYEIDLDKQYPGMKIVMSTYKEFVRVSIDGGDEDALGKLVGLLGDFNTGKTFARDGATILDDFSELGNEWQVMPSEPKLFHEIEHPQFPEKCIQPEDPRGERRRRLAENIVTEEAAEAACARLTNAADRKDCVYDILATQDMGMVGAY